MSEYQHQPHVSEGGMTTQLDQTRGMEPAIAVEAITPQPTNKRQEVTRIAAELFRQNPDWVTFFREILGVEGAVRRILSSPEEIEAFEQTREHAEIQAMLAKLREKSKNHTENNEPTRVITVRMPQSLHESLKAESHQRQMSMNQLCISKLLQLIDSDFVPSA